MHASTGQGQDGFTSQISVEIKCCFPNPENYRITSGIPKSRSLDVKTLKTREIKDSIRRLEKDPYSPMCT